MNDRKIPLSLELGFWNIVIATLTICKDIRTFSQTTPAVMPTLQKKNVGTLYKTARRSTSSSVKTNRNDLVKVFSRIGLLAVFGFVLGILSGILLGI